RSGALGCDRSVATFRTGSIRGASQSLRPCSLLCVPVALSIAVRSDAHRVAVVDDRANHARSSIPVVGEVATWWHQPSNLAAIQIDERGAGSDPPGEPCGRPTAVGFELAVHAADKVEALTAKSPDARFLAIGKKTRDRYPRRASMALSFLERVSENA